MQGIGAASAACGKAIILDRRHFVRELSRRGLSQRAFAKEADLPEATLSHALGGRPVQAGTLKRIVETLDRIPALNNVDHLILQPDLAGATA